MEHKLMKYKWIRCVAIVFNGRLGAFSSFLMGSSLYVASFCSTASHLRPIKEKWDPEKYLRSLAIKRSNPVPRLALPPMMDPRSRYSTPSQKLVLALDIGTTFSGAAYVYVDPGRHSQIRLVTRRVLPPIPDPATRDNE